MEVTTYKPNGLLHKTSVDFNKRLIDSPVHIVQYDDRLPIIAVKMYDNGNPYILPNDAEAKIRFGKPDKTYVYSSALGCDSTRNELYFEITQQMTIFHGDYYPVVEIKHNNNVGNSSPIHIIIDRNPIQRDYIESCVEYKEFSALANEAKQSASDALKSEKAAKTSETNAKASETNAKTSETNAKASETNAANSASKAKASETNASQCESNAAASASAAKQSEDKAKEYMDAAFSTTPEGYDKVVDAALYGIKRTTERKLDSQEGSILLSAQGMSHQEVLSGKNLYYINAFIPRNISDLTVTLDKEEQTVTYSSDLNGDGSFANINPLIPQSSDRRSFIDLKKYIGEKMTVSIEYLSGTRISKWYGIIYNLYDENYEIIGSSKYVSITLDSIESYGQHKIKTFDVDELLETSNAKYLLMSYWIPQDNKAVNEKYRIQVEVGEDMTPWEKSTGGEGSPSPNYPAEIKSANVKVKTVGKNLIPFPYYYKTPYTYNGITVTPNDDGSLTLNGTATAVTYFVLTHTLDKERIRLKKDTPYMLTGGDGKVRLVISKSDNSAQLCSTITSGIFISSDDEPAARLFIYYTKDTVFNNVVIYPQLIAIEPRERNLIPFPYYDGMKLSSNGIDWTVNEDGSVTANGTCDSDKDSVFDMSDYNIKTENNKKYFLSGCPSGGGYAKYAIQWFTSNWSDVIATDIGNGKVFTPNNAYSTRCRLIVFKGATVNNVTFYPQLELGEVATEYEPPKHPLSYYTTYEPYRSTEADTDITLRAIEVTVDDEYTYEKDGKYYAADELRMVNDRYEIVRRVGEEVIDNNSIIDVSNDKKYLFISTSYVNQDKYILPYKNSITPIAMSNLFKSGNYDKITSDDGNGYMYFNAESKPPHFYFRNDKMTSLDDWKVFLSENTIHLLLLLCKNPTIEPISTDDAKKLLSLKSWKDTTHVYNDSDVDAPITIMYGDTEVACKSLSGFASGLINAIRNNDLEEVEKILTDEWDEHTLYPEGKLRIHDNKLWKCKVQNSGMIPEEGDFWMETTLEKEIEAIWNFINDMNK